MLDYKFSLFKRFHVAVVEIQKKSQHPSSDSRRIEIQHGEGIRSTEENKSMFDIQM
jgi:hypothetical protein